MPIRRLCTTLALAMSLAGLAPVPAAADPGSAPVVAVIDTGIRASHQEFEPGQVVAWWNFVDESSYPTLGQTWDPRHPVPFDDHGHGTATASLVAGNNRRPAKEPSFAPGTKLAVARACPSLRCDVAPLYRAIRWAVDSARADVVSFSIGAAVPYPALLDSVGDAIRYAHDAGVLVVLANGNGAGGIGPTPSWFNPGAGSPYALTVGADDAVWQNLVNSEPEVTARFLDVEAAWSDADDDYATLSGTSFGTPLVAGMAARAIAEARSAGAASSPGRIERVLKGCARPAGAHPRVEGYGVLDAATLPCVLHHAAAGTAPAPRPEAAFWVDEIGGTMRRAWHDDAGDHMPSFAPLHAVAPGSGRGRMSAGLPGGFVEGERYLVTLAPGEGLTASLRFDGALTGGSRIYAFRGTGPIFEGSDLIDSSPTYFGSGSEPLQIRGSGTYTLIVAGWFPALHPPEGFTLLASTTDPGTPEPAYDGESYYVTAYAYAY